VCNDRPVLGGPDIDGGNFGCFKNGLKHRVVCQSVEVGVEFLFVEIRLRDRLILVGTVVIIVYRMLGSGHYGLDTFESAWSDLLPLYGQIFLLGDFNVDLFDSGN
jgi:hypothetical protein